MAPEWIAACVALAVALALTPVMAVVARGLGIVDWPGDRKVHLRAVPYLGGAAVLGAMCVGVAVTAPAPDLLGDGRLAAVLAGAMVLFVVGLVDDVRGLAPATKLCAQVAVAVAVWWVGLRVDHWSVVDGFTLQLGWLSLPLTVLWMVGITNAMNLIDGIDGLAATIGSIAAGAIGFIALSTGQPEIGIVLLALCGALLGFLPYNMHRARIFLGDSGSLLLGFLLSTASVYSTAKSATFVGLAVPMLSLGIPILDTVFSMVRRLIERRSVFSPDKNHIHHRLLALGFDQPRVVALLGAETLVATGLGVWSMRLDSGVRLAVFVGVLGLHVLLFRSVGAVRLRDSVRVLRDVAARVRLTKAERYWHDKLDLQFRACATVDDWWQAVTRAADSLGCARARLALERRNGERDLRRWVRSPPLSCGVSRYEAVLPVRHRRGGDPVALQVDFDGRLPLELSGRRLALLGRLLDRHGIASLPADPARADADHAERPVAAAVTPPRSIAIVGSRGIPARYGGFETFAEHLSRDLTQRGHRVVVTCERTPGATAEDLPARAGAVELRHVLAPRLGPLSTIVHDALCLWRLRRTTDVVYLLGYGAAFAAWLPRWWGREVWINPDGVEWARAKWGAVGRLWFRWMEWCAMRAAHVVVADAGALGAHLRGRHPRARARIVEIAYGAERGTDTSAATVRAHGLVADGYLLIVCRPEPENHVVELIEGYATAAVSMPLVVIGDTARDTPYCRRVRAAAEAAGPGVRLLGPEYDRRRLTDLRAHCRAYLHGHSVGGTNPSLLEALAAGNAVVAHDNAFNREVLAGVPSAWFVNRDGVAAAIHRIAAASAADLAVRRQAARQRVATAYGWTQIGDRYHALLGHRALPQLVPADRGVQRSRRPAVTG